MAVVFMILLLVMVVFVPMPVSVTMGLPRLMHVYSVFLSFLDELVEIDLSVSVIVVNTDNVVQLCVIHGDSGLHEHVAQLFFFDVSVLVDIYQLKCAPHTIDVIAIKLRQALQPLYLCSSALGYLQFHVEELAHVLLDIDLPRRQLLPEFVSLRYPLLQALLVHQLRDLDAFFECLLHRPFLRLFLDVSLHVVQMFALLYVITVKAKHRQENKQRTDDYSQKVQQHEVRIIFICQRQFVDCAGALNDEELQLGRVETFL